MDENIDYLEAVTNKITEAKLLAKISPEQRDFAIQLLNKKKEIHKKNGLFAQLQINHLDKQLNKLLNQKNS